MTNMLMHQGIGLDRFNAMPRKRAVHALYECCCCVTWAQKLADARPFGSHDDVFAKADLELLEFSQSDLDRVYETCMRCGVDNSIDMVAKVTRTRIARMLGPEGGWPEY